MNNTQKRKILDVHQKEKVVIRYRGEDKKYHTRVIIPIEKEGKDLYLANQRSGYSKRGLNKNKTNLRTFDLDDLQIVEPKKEKK